MKDQGILDWGSGGGGGGGGGPNFGHRPSCRHHCRPVEKAETTTCSSICERRPGVGGGGGYFLIRG